MLEIFLIFLYRISEPIGSNRKVPFLASGDVNSFVKQAEKSIVIFSDDVEKCNFINYAHLKLKDNLKFAIAPEKYGENYNCKDYPCTVPFENGEQVNYLPLPSRIASLFYSWCKHFVNPKYSRIANKAKLQTTLNSIDGACVIGIDTADMPSDLPSDMMFYSVDSDVVHSLNISAEKGVYVFRSSDRELVKVENGNYKDLTETPIVAFKNVDFSKKKYVAGFWIDDLNPERSENEISILNQLSKEESDLANDFYFSSYDLDVIVKNRLYYRPVPLFAVFKKEGDNLLRWTFSGEQTHDSAFLKKVMNQIRSGELSSGPLNNKDEGNSHSISYFEFTEKVNEDKDVFLVIVKNEETYASLVSTAKIVTELFQSDQITYYWINLSENDIPHELNPSPTATFYLFPKGNKKSPIPYSLSRVKVFDVLNFIKRHSSIKYDLPSYNIVQKESEIRELRDLILNQTIEHNI